MKKLINKIFVMSLLGSLSLSSFAEIEKLPSLEWQVQDLEVKISKKIESVLSSILQSNQYAVNVEIIANQPIDPEFNKTDEDEEEEKRNQREWEKELQRLVEQSKETDKKLEESVALAEKKAEEAKKLEEQKKEEAKKSSAAIKYTDVSPDETKTGENILFSKFGMEAPLVEDFNDLRPDGKIVLTMNATNNKAAEEEERLKKLVEEKERELQKFDRDMQKQQREYSLKEAALVNKIRIAESAGKKSSVSPVEQTWRYNKAVDVFKNLREVNIKVRLSKGLDEEIKQKVEGYVRGMKFNLGRVNPKIKFEYAVLGADLAKPTKEQVLKEWLELISRYATLIGLVLAVILLGIVGTKLIKKYFEYTSGNQSSGSFKMENHSDDKDKDPEEVAALGGGGGLGDGTGAGAGVFSLNGVERFKYYIRSAPNDAILLVKRWISSDERGAKDALKAIVQQMENEDLQLIFSKLSGAQKLIWRELLNHPLSAAELSRANDYISNQIIQNVIIPSAITDPGTYDLVLKLTPEKVVNLAKNEPQIVAVLMNILSGSFINEVLSQCSQSDRERIISESINMTQDQIALGQETLKRTLQRIVENKEPKPFIDKLLSLVHMATPEVEDSLHRALGKNHTRDQLKKLGMDLFPAALITDLPVGFLKATLLSYPLEKRMRMLYSLDSEMQSFFINVIAPQGSKAFDMVSLEFEKIESDQAEVEKIQAESSKIWFEFVTYTRKEIKNDKTYSREIMELVNAWADDLYQEPVKISLVS